MYRLQGRWADAERTIQDGLAVLKRLHGDRPHPRVATSLNNLGMMYHRAGKWADAERPLKDALEMWQRLHGGRDHPNVATSLYNLGSLYGDQKRWAEAERYLGDALDVFRRRTVQYAHVKSEGEALTFAAAQPLVRDAYLWVAHRRAAATPFDAAAAYPAVWATKGLVARVYEERHLQARAAADPRLAGKIAEIAECRRRRADLLLDAFTTDPDVLELRKPELDDLDRQLAKLNAAVRDALPEVERRTRLNGATAADLQKELPADAALVDYVRYSAVESDEAKPAGQKDKWTPRYVAFVVTRDKVTWVDVGEAKVVEPAVREWRGALAAGRSAGNLGTAVRKLVWDGVRKALPAGVKVVYVCPDGALCAMPFAALPGDKPNEILLHDFALATVPHAPFLLDKLWAPDGVKGRPAAALAVGGVKYDADVRAGPGPDRAEPAVAAGQPFRWLHLAATDGEARGMAKVAGGKNLTANPLTGEQATVTAVLGALPKARVAHLATHGFFADPSVPGPFPVTPGEYERTRRGERLGRVANSPLVLTGLVLAGANHPHTPGRGVITGEALVDLDLSGLELAVLSACETGLGDSALPGGGEGVFGLQRAFHYAGTRDVVASLWRVPDAATAALMGEFYRNLWDKDMRPAEALRQAQLKVYRSDPQQFKDLVSRGIGVGKTPLSAVPELIDPKDPKSGVHPKQWAAFTLSGPGR